MSSSDVGRDLDWLNEALFREGGFRSPDRTSATHARWAMLPNGRSPRRLVPVESAGAAGAMTNRHDAMGPKRRLAGAALERLVATGLPGLAARDRLTLDNNLGVGGEPVESALATMTENLPSAAFVAVTLGPRRYNRKPVVQIMDGAGRSLAFAKLACDPATAAFVENETKWLGRASAASHVVARVPGVVASGEWNGKALLTAEAVPPAGHKPASLDQDRLAQLTIDVASLDPIVETTVAGSAALERVDAAAAAVDDDETTAAVAAVRAKFGDRPLQVGAWHGDFSPWNMLSTESHTWLLDWEFASDAMPVGSDLLHNRVMVQTHLEDVDIGAALDALRYTATGLLDAVNGGSDPDAAFAMYLLELCRRDAMLASFGAPPTGFGPAALAALRDLGAAE